MRMKGGKSEELQGGYFEDAGKRLEIPKKEMALSEELWEWTERELRANGIE